MTADTVKAEQALQLLDDIASQVKLTRAEHVRVQQAVGTLREALLARIPEPAPDGGDRYEVVDQSTVGPFD